MSKTEVISQNSKNGLKSANFWAIKAKKIPDSEFLQGFGYSNTLEGTNSIQFKSITQNAVQHHKRSSGIGP